MKMKTIEGNFELQEGIKLILTPGHTNGSQSVLVDTAEGPYVIAGDLFMTRRNWETGTMVGLFSNAEKWFNSYQKIQAINPVNILMMHDEESYLRDVFGQI